MEDFGLLDFVWWMLIAYLWVAVLWAFISVFADIFRRNDLSGAAKAGWIFLLIIVPFLGILIYMMARPRMTEQDREMLSENEKRQGRMGGYSPAQEIERLAKLRDEGKITAEEYERLKTRAMA